MRKIFAIPIGIVFIYILLHVTVVSYKVNAKVSFIVSLSIGIVIVYLISRVRKRRKVYQKETEEKSQFQYSDIAKKYGLTLYGFGDSNREYYGILANPFRGILVIGSPGSGKTESIILQLISQFAKRYYSGIIYDFKYPELTNDMNSFLNHYNSNIKHYSLNFTDLSRTYRVNPLAPEYIPNMSYAREYAKVIVNNLDHETIKKKDIWTRSSIDLLTASIWYLKENHPMFCTLPHAIRLILQDDETLLTVLSQDLATADLIKSMLTALKREAGGQLSGQIGTLQSMLGSINTPEIVYILTGNEFSLDLNNPKDPAVLSIGTDMKISDTFSPVISLIISVATRIMQNPDKHHSFLLIDELPTLYLPNIEKIPSTARSCKMSTVFTSQDISQIIDIYGEHKSDVFISLLSNQYFGKTSSLKTAEYISRLFGKHDKEFITKGSSQGHSQGNQLLAPGSQSAGQSESHVIHERDRIRPQELIQMETGRFTGFMVETEADEFNLKMKIIDRPPKIEFDKRDYENPRKAYEQVNLDIERIISINKG